MFARKPATPSPSPPANSGPDWLAAISNPYLGAGAAALLLVGAVGALIAITGDPHAGAPSLRISLDPAGKAAPKLDRPTAPLGGDGAISLDNMTAGQEMTLPDASAAVPIQGQAVITLPQGGSMGGGEAGPTPAAASAPPPIVHSVGPPLPKAPIAGLAAPGPGGLLPIIAGDGRTPFQAYARPFRDNGKPKVALVISGLGLNAASTKTAIERLPPEVTLSFVSYTEGLQGWVDQARAAGHEVMIEIPMEPLDYPNNDPGQYTLMSGASSAETVKRLEWLLARATGYFAVTNYLGGRFLNSNTAMGAFTGALKARGLGFIDDGAAAHKAVGIPRATALAVVDEQLSVDSIDRALLGLEAQALQHGAALGVGFSYPVTVEQVGRWAQGLPGRGYQLAPASAITRR
jgi:polysaccharide deacetylase 2 family uncharacterized protein YibQ